MGRLSLLSSLSWPKRNSFGSILCKWTLNILRSKMSTNLYLFLLHTMLLLTFPTWISSASKRFTVPQCKSALRGFCPLVLVLCVPLAPCVPLVVLFFFAPLCLYRAPGMTRRAITFNVSFLSGIRVLTARVRLQFLNKQLEYSVIAFLGSFAMMIMPP